MIRTASVLLVEWRSLPARRWLHHILASGPSASSGPPRRLRACVATATIAGPACTAIGGTDTARGGTRKIRGICE
jgi:hypothetical protein